jgi:predicted DNA-binding transcriptional regulator AlpA
MARIIASDGNLVVVDFGGPAPLLTKKQVARALGFSQRWVELRVADGMPSSLDKKGRRRFRLSDVQDWLNTKEAADG